MRKRQNRKSTLAVRALGGSGQNGAERPRWHCSERLTMAAPQAEEDDSEDGRATRGSV